MAKKILAVLLALAMTLSLFSFNVFAADEVVEYETAVSLITDGKGLTGTAFTGPTIGWGSKAIESTSAEWADFVEAVNTEGARFVLKYTITGEPGKNDKGEDDYGWFNFFQASTEPGGTGHVSVPNYSSDAGKFVDTLDGEVMSNQWSLLHAGEHVVTYNTADWLEVITTHTCTDHHPDGGVTLDDVTNLCFQSGMPASLEVAFNSLVVEVPKTADPEPEPSVTYEETAIDGAKVVDVNVAVSADKDAPTPVSWVFDPSGAGFGNQVIDQSFKTPYETNPDAYIKLTLSAEGSVTAIGGYSSQNVSKDNIKYVDNPTIITVAGEDGVTVYIPAKEVVDAFGDIGGMWGIAITGTGTVKTFSLVNLKESGTEPDEPPVDEDDLALSQKFEWGRWAAEAINLYENEEGVARYSTTVGEILARFGTAEITFTVKSVTGEKATETDVSKVFTDIVGSATDHGWIAGAKFTTTNDGGKVTVTIDLKSIFKDCSASNKFNEFKLFVLTPGTDPADEEARITTVITEPVLRFVEKAPEESEPKGYVTDPAFTEAEVTVDEDGNIVITPDGKVETEGLLITFDGDGAPADGTVVVNCVTDDGEQIEVFNEPDGKSFDDCVNSWDFCGFGGLWGRDCANIFDITLERVREIFATEGASFVYVYGGTPGYNNGGTPAAVLNGNFEAGTNFAVTVEDGLRVGTVKLADVMAKSGVTADKIDNFVIQISTDNFKLYKAYFVLPGVAGAAPVEFKAGQKYVEIPTSKKSAITSVVISYEGAKAEDIVSVKVKSEDEYNPFAGLNGYTIQLGEDYHGFLFGGHLITLPHTFGDDNICTACSYERKNVGPETVEPDWVLEKTGGQDFNDLTVAGGLELVTTNGRTRLATSWQSDVYGQLVDALNTYTDDIIKITYTGTITAFGIESENAGIIDVECEVTEGDKNVMTVSVADFLEAGKPALDDSSWRNIYVVAEDGAVLYSFEIIKDVPVEEPKPELTTLDQGDACVIDISDLGLKSGDTVHIKIAGTVSTSVDAIRLFLATEGAFNNNASDIVNAELDGNSFTFEGDLTAQGDILYLYLKSQAGGPALHPNNFEFTVFSAEKA